MLPYQQRDPTDVRRGLRDGQGLAASFGDRDTGVAFCLDGVDLVPRRRKFPLRDPVLINRDDVPLLQDPTDHREDIDHKERARHDEEHELLLKVKEDERDQEKQKCQDRDDCGALQEQRRRTMRADELAELLLVRSRHDRASFCVFRVFCGYDCETTEGTEDTESTER